MIFLLIDVVEKAVWVFVSERAPLHNFLTFILQKRVVIYLICGMYDHLFQLSDNFHETLHIYVYMHD